jgi:hypothetical protein
MDPKTLPDDSVAAGGRDPRSLPEDIYGVLDERNDHEVSEENVQWAGEVFKEVLRSRFKKREERRGERAIYFSSLGKQDRQMWYAANKPETAEKLLPKTLFKFLYGDALEVLLLFLAKEAGHEVTHEQHRVEIDGIGGYTDAVIDGVPVDCKSASPFSYDKFADGRFVFDDPFGYIKQLSGYAHALEKTDRAGFLVANKVHGDICFAELDGYTIKANPPAQRIEALKEVISRPVPPARCYPSVPEGKSGNQKLGIGCSYCPFKQDCWSDANGGQGLRTFYYASGPRYFTHIQREPKVDEGT